MNAQKKTKTQKSKKQWGKNGVENIANVKRPFALQIRLCSPRNFGETCFRRFPTFHCTMSNKFGYRFCIFFPDILIFPGKDMCLMAKRQMCPGHETCVSWPKDICHCVLAKRHLCSGQYAKRQICLGQETNWRQASPGVKKLAWCLLDPVCQR